MDRWGWVRYLVGPVAMFFCVRGMEKGDKGRRVGRGRGMGKGDGDRGGELGKREGDGEWVHER